MFKGNILLVVLFSISTLVSASDKMSVTELACQFYQDIGEKEVRLYKKQYGFNRESVSKNQYHNMSLKLNLEEVITASSKAFSKNCISSRGDLDMATSAAEKVWITNCPNSLSDEESLHCLAHGPLFKKASEHIGINGPFKKLLKLAASANSDCVASINSTSRSIGDEVETQIQSSSDSVKALEE